MRGVVLARMATATRQREVRVIEFVLQKLGVRIAGRIPEGQTLEGGDFIPAGPGMCSECREVQLVWLDVFIQVPVRQR